MTRTFFSVGLMVMVAILALEVVHYRSATVECNVDNKRAWGLVVQYRRLVELPHAQASSLPAASSAPASSSGGGNAGQPK